MSVRTFLSGWALALGSLTAIGALSAGGVLSTSSEAVLRSSFSTALASQSSIPQVAKAAPVAGSEEFWLTASRNDGSLAVTKAISVGDRIALTLGGLNRQLEVAEVSEYAPKVTEIVSGSGPSHFVLVTARDTASKDARSVRFVMEVEQKPATAIGAQARAL